MAGGSVMHMSNPIQRFLRDLLAMRNHPMGALESSAITYARSVLENCKRKCRNSEVTQLGYLGIGVRDLGE